MQFRRAQNATGSYRAAAVALVSMLLASCAASGDTDVANPSFAAGAGAVAGATVAENDAFATAATTNSAAGEGAEGALPDMVGYVPLTRPDGAGALANAVEESPPAEVAVAAEASGATQPVEAAVAAAPAEAAVGETEVAAEATPAVDPAKPAFVLTQGDPSVFENDQTMEVKKKGFLSSFFGTSTAQGGAVAKQAKPNPVIKVETENPQPLVQLASVGTTPRPARAAYDPGDNGLPGVRQSALFEIKRKSGLDDDSDVDLHEDEADPIQVASAAGLARLAPNGLLKQRESVDVACLKPALVRVLKQIERHYGRKIVVTSGYRNASYNRQVRGAKNSMHMYCAAADIQMSGVSKWELAKYVRSMPGRGGVGTYCHTESVHVDIGPERDWNWRCRRRS